MNKLRDYFWFPLALVLIFTTAKVFGFINWSWIQVWFPVWIIGAALLAGVLLVLIIGILSSIILGVVKRFKAVFNHDQD